MRSEWTITKTPIPLVEALEREVAKLQRFNAKVEASEKEVVELRKKLVEAQQLADVLEKSCVDFEAFLAVNIQLTTTNDEVEKVHTEVKMQIDIVVKRDAWSGGYEELEFALLLAPCKKSNELGFDPFCPFGGRFTDFQEVIKLNVTDLLFNGNVLGMEDISHPTIRAEDPSIDLVKGHVFKVTTTVIEPRGDHLLS
ncbi:hypothetical protein V6N13_042528 [Hibiscus sabdariffa]